MSSQMDESASRKASHAQGRSSHTHPHPHMLFSRRSQQIDKHQQFPDVSHIDDLLAEREFQRRVFSTPSFARSKRKKDELVETLAPDVSVKDARRYYSIERSIPMEDDNRYPDNIWAYDRTAIRVPKDLTTGWTDPAGSTSSENEYSDEAWHPAPSKWSSPYGPSSHKKIVTKAVDESLYINANVLTDGKGSFWVISQAPLPNGIHTFFMAILTNTASAKVLSRRTTHSEDRLSRRISISSIQSNSTISSQTQRLPGTFSLHSFKKAIKGSGEREKKRSGSEIESKSHGRHVIIVQLAGFEENGVCKADPYLPTVPGKTMIYHPPSAAAGHHPKVEVRLISTTANPHLGSTHSVCTLSAVAASPSPEASAPTSSSHTHANEHRHPSSFGHMAGTSSGRADPSRHTVNLSHEHDPTLSLDGLSLHSHVGGDHGKIDLNTMTIHHFDYHGWPDHGVPKGHDVRCLRKLVEEVGAVQRLHGCEVWVHCSAGVGRSGTFVALSSLLLPVQRHPTFPGHALPLDDFSTSPLAPLVDELARDPIAVTIDRLREQRSWLCERKEQVELLYKMVLVGEGE